jgi:hypothetical protein
VAGATGNRLRHRNDLEPMQARFTDVFYIPPASGYTEFVANVYAARFIHTLARRDSQLGFASWTIPSGAEHGCWSLRGNNA